MRLNDFNIKIVTVHSSSSIRQLINSELRAQGFQDVVGAPDLKSLVSILEAHPVQWVITTPFLQDELTFFQIMKLATDDLEYTDMRLSLVSDSDLDIGMLSKAYDLGLLSHHENVKTKTDIEELLRGLLKLNEDLKGELDLVAADYLRRAFILNSKWPELMAFERNLFHHHPGNLEVALRLAEASLRNGQREIAAHLFHQIQVIDSTFDPRINELWMHFVGEEFDREKAKPPVEHPGMLGLRSCLIVEPDPEQLEQVKDLLIQVGVKNVLAFRDSAEALKRLEEKDLPELILFEWRMDPVPGPIFVQRVREIMGYSVPLTVMNRDLTERDMPILREMGVTTRITKPIEAQGFFRDLTWIIHQDRAPSEPFIILQKIKHAMQEQDFERLANLTKRYMKSPQVSNGDKSLLQAELAYYRGNFHGAKNMALRALREGLASVDVLNLLGKAMMKIRDFSNALRCFENAQVISPSNVRRICNIAEIHLESGNDAAYQESIAAASDLDPDAKAIAEVEVKAALTHGDTEKAKTLMESLKSLMTILSFTNNRAIAQIRCNQFEEGIGLYQEALNAVPTEQKDIHTILQYNLGLALARQNRLEEAKHILQAAQEAHSLPKIQQKAKSLLARVLRALSTGERFAVKDAPQDHAAQDDQGRDPQKDLEEMMLAFRVGPGDICLFRIHVDHSATAELQEIIERSLDLKKRSTIQRVS